VSSAAERPRTAAEQEHRHVAVVVLVAVAHPAAIQDDRVIEQVPVAVGCRAELLEVVREQRACSRR
jgi:hypothetical protein